MKTERFVVPAEFGGGEFEAVEQWSGCNGARPEYYIGGRFTLVAPAGQPLKRVRPPDPPEPAVGEFVACGTDGNPLPFFRRWAEGWSAVSRDPQFQVDSWSDVVDIARERAGRDPLLLTGVPPVSLPWRSDSWLNSVNVNGRTVVDDVGEGRQLIMTPETARAKGNALLAAAEKAERNGAA